MIDWTADDPELALEKVLADAMADPRTPFETVIALSRELGALRNARILDEASIYGPRCLGHDRLRSWHRRSRSHGPTRAISVHWSVLEPEPGEPTTAKPENVTCATCRKHCIAKGLLPSGGEKP